MRFDGRERGVVVGDGVPRVHRHVAAPIGVVGDEAAVQRRRVRLDRLEPVGVGNEHARAGVLESERIASGPDSGARGT